MSSILRSQRILRNELKKNVQEKPELQIQFGSKEERNGFIHELEQYLATVKTRRANFFQLHQEMLKVKVETEVDKKTLDTQIDQAATFLLELDTCIDLTSIHLQRLLRDQEREIAHAAIEHQAQAQAQVQAQIHADVAPAFAQAPVPVRAPIHGPARIKLPKIEIQAFNGEITKWKEFWDSFETAVHRNDAIAGVDKFSYLRSFLEGEAKTAISGLALTNENYAAAVTILMERFGNDQLVIQAHYAAISNLAPAQANNENFHIYSEEDRSK